MNQMQRLVRVAFLDVFIVGFASTLFHKSVSAEVGLNILAIYIVPETMKESVKLALQDESIEVVSTLTETDDLVKQHPQLTILYFHEEIFEQIETKWIQQYLDKGIYLVAINTPISDMENKLDRSLKLEDLRLEFSRNRLPISTYYSYIAPKGLGGRELASTDFFTDIATYHHILINTPLVPSSAVPCVTGMSSKQTWTDSYGKAMTGCASYSSITRNAGGFFYADYLGHGYTSYNSSAYYLSLYIEGWNNCDYPHRITQTSSWGNYVSYVEATIGPIATTQPGGCGQSPYAAWVNTTHTSQRSLGGPYFTKTLSKTWTVTVQTLTAPGN